jgi:hypothetical protein
MDPSPFYVGLLVVRLDFYFKKSVFRIRIFHWAADPDPDSVEHGTETQKLALFHNTIFLKDIRLDRIRDPDSRRKI